MSILSWKNWIRFVFAGLMALFVFSPVQALLPPKLPEPIDPDKIVLNLIPSLHVVKPVPVETYDKTPEFTFYSSQAGNIIYGGDCVGSITTAVAGDNLVVFGTLDVGVHSNCTVAVRNVLDLTSAKLDVPDFEVKAGVIIDPILIDMVAPEISLVSGVDSPTTNTTPSVVIQTNEAGFVSYQGACLSTASNVVLGKNTITFMALEPGTYSNCKIRVADVWGNLSSAITIPAFTITQTAQSLCAGFTDVVATDSDCGAISYVKSIDAMTGNPDGTFDPAGLLQRDQIAKIALNSFGNFSGSADYCAGKNPFPDVTAADWAYQYICRAKALAVVTGYEAGADAGYFRPARSVNRAEFLAIILRNLGEIMPTGASYTDVHSTDWFADYAKYSNDNSLFSGATLKPANFTSRREVAQVLYKLHNLGKI